VGTELKRVKLGSDVEGGGASELDGSEDSEGTDYEEARRKLAKEKEKFLKEKRKLERSVTKFAKQKAKFEAKQQQVEQMEKKNKAAAKDVKRQIAELAEEEARVAAREQALEKLQQVLAEREAVGKDREAAELVSKRKSPSRSKAHGRNGWHHQAEGLGLDKAVVPRCSRAIINGWR
jgi:DNA repair exonuclease SbcCD ATPase subunit